jgi:hypothetical protein
MLAGGPGGTRFTRAGPHLLVFTEFEGEVVFLDLLPARRDLPHHPRKLDLS